MVQLPEQRRMPTEMPQDAPPSHRHSGFIGRILNHHNVRTGVIAGGVVVGALAVSNMIPGCDTGPIQESTQLGDLGGVLYNVVVPKSSLGIIEGDGTGTGEVIDAKYLHVPKLPLIGFLADAANGVLEKLYQTCATAKVNTSVEIILASDAMTLKPYRLVKAANSSSTLGLDGEGVEADVKVGGLTSVLVDKSPIKPNESSCEGFGSRVSDVVEGNGDTTKTDNAAVYVAEAYFQNVCGRALLDLSYVGVERYVQNIFKLDAGYFKGFPGVSTALDHEMYQLSQEPVHVVFTHDEKPINPNKVGLYVNDFGPPLPNSKNIAKLVDNTPNNVIVPREVNGCTSTTFAIKQQEQLIQQAAAATASPKG